MFLRISLFDSADIDKRIVAATRPDASTPFQESYLARSTGISGGCAECPRRSSEQTVWYVAVIVFPECSGVSEQVGETGECDGGKEASELYTLVCLQRMNGYATKIPYLQSAPSMHMTLKKAA